MVLLTVAEYVSVARCRRLTKVGSKVHGDSRDQCLLVSQAICTLGRLCHP